MPCHHTDICLQLARSDTRLIQDAIRLTHTQITIIYGGEETIIIIIIGGFIFTVIGIIKTHSSLGQYY